MPKYVLQSYFHFLISPFYPLKEDDEPTYLGVTFDKRQTWKPHLQEAETRARRKLALMRKLAGSTWGPDKRTLQIVYEGAIRPHLEYGAEARPPNQLYSQCIRCTIRP